MPQGTSRFFATVPITFGRAERSGRASREGVPPGDCDGALEVVVSGAGAGNALLWSSSPHAVRVARHRLGTTINVASRDIWRA